VVGIDLSEGMLEVGKRKVRGKGLSGLIDLELGDAEALPYRDGVFDAATVGFGGRNVTHLDRLFGEMGRVVKDGGRVVFLEISRPWLPGFRQLFDLYFQRVTPLIGGLVSGDRKAYTYLPQSLTVFPDVDQVARIMREAGLADVSYRRLAFGIVTIHVGTARHR
jgi:demethylmenaquinone methyltransferase/2-methoxy-6-polyprenyl-1,4-benzoquinol methylase